MKERRRLNAAPSASVSRNHSPLVRLSRTVRASIVDAFGIVGLELDLLDELITVRLRATASPGSGSWRKEIMATDK